MLYIVIWRMSICTKVFPDWDVGLRGINSWKCPGLKQTDLPGNMLELGGKWVSHPAGIGDFKSPPPHHPEPRTKGRPQQVLHTDWISAV